MQPDDIADAFTRWKAAYEDFRTAEQQLFLRTRSQSVSLAPGAAETDALILQVQLKRTHADNLLMSAMRLLHERRKGSGDVPPHT